jgi:hypothetical protein
MQGDAPRFSPEMADGGGAKKWSGAVALQQWQGSSGGRGGQQRGPTARGGDGG